MSAVMNTGGAVQSFGLNFTKPDTAAKYLKIFVYGASGVGKTVFAGTAEDDERTAPVLYGDIEGGVLSIKNRGRALDVVRITSINPVMISIKKYLESKERKHNTLVVDSLTDLQALSMAEIRGTMVPTAIPTMQQWGQNTDQIKAIVRQFRDLPVNLIMTGLSQEVRDEGTGVVLNRPLLPGKLSRGITQYFDVVGYLTVVKVAPAEKGQPPRLVRRLYVQPTENWDAKDRDGSLGNYVDNPTVPKLLGLIHGTPAQAPARVSKPDKSAQRAPETAEVS